MVKNDRPGILSTVSLTVDERELFLDYLNSAKPNINADYIFAVLGDKEFLKFFDVFSNENIKIPSREEVLKIINYIKIYNYCEKHNFSETSLEQASKIFCKRKMSIARIIEKVDKILKGLEIDE